jgi:hypothetical protein
VVVAERAPFKPKGDLPEWRLIYDKLLERADFGDVITLDQLDEVLDRPFSDNRGPLYRARNHLGDMRRRWIEAVPGVGYRVIEAAEHMTVAQGRKNRARRQLRAMVRIGEITDLSRLTPDQLAQFDSQAKVNAAVYMALVHHERRLTRLEEVLRADGKL